LIKYIAWNEKKGEPAREMTAGCLSAKGGLMMGTKKVGALSSPLKKAIVIIPKIFQM
jgi:hypothetical protein